MIFNREKAFKVINTLLKFEVSYGHLKWKMTDISRISGVHRSLIYYHFGKTKKEIFDRCLQVISEEFYGTSKERMELVDQGRLLDCVTMNFKMFKKDPDFIVFYNKARLKSSPIQQRFIQIEKQYQSKLQKIFPHLNFKEIKALHAVIQGVVGSPVLDLETFEIAMKSIIGPFVEKN